MSQDRDIKKLADEVLRKRDHIKNLWLSKECHRLFLATEKMVQPGAITIPTQEKQRFMREALDDAVSHFPFEERGAIKSALGSELSRRKTQRKEEEKARLTSLVEENSDTRDTELQASIAKMKRCLDNEMVRRLCGESLIAEGRAMRNEHGDLIIFNFFGDE